MTVMMNRNVVLLLAAVAVQFFVVTCSAQEPIVDDTVVFAEKDGLLAVEAEHFFRQTSTDVRKFYLTHSKLTPDVKPDGDPNHVGGASGGAYLEILPDTRRNHSQKLIRGENFSSDPGKLAVLHYKVHISTPGKYYVWVNAHSTGSEDNGLHVGIDGAWPESGQRLQWCEGKQSWRWESKQRTEEQHCGERHKIYLEIAEAGEHVIHFSMREDGFEFDKWLMTTDREFVRPKGHGPASLVKSGKLPKPFPLIAAPMLKKATNRSSANNQSGKKGSPTKSVADAPLQMPRQPNGDGTITISGEAKAWHKLTLAQAGPYAHEKDNAPNPFTDYCMTVTFTHPDGDSFTVPGYFAADGDAGNSSAEYGTCLLYTSPSPRD